MSKHPPPQEGSCALQRATFVEMNALNRSAALIQARYLHRLLLDADGGMWEWHPHSGQQRAIGSIWQLFHREAEHALSGLWTGEQLQLVHAEDRSRLLELRQRLYQQGAWVDTQFRVYTSKGEQRWLRLWARAHTDADHQRFFTGGCVTGSELVEAQYLSDLTGEGLLNAPAGLGDGHWEWDLRTHKVVFDQACWLMLGFESGQADLDAKAAFNQWKGQILAEDYARVEQALKDCRHKPLPLDLEYRLRHKSGRIVWIRCRGELQYGGTGQALQVLGVLQDVTADREKSASIQSELKRLRTEHTERAELLFSLSHELRTPLNAILGFSHLVESDQSLNPDQRTRVTEIRKASQHLLHLVGDVLDLARIDSNQLVPSLEPMQPAALVADCKRLLEPLAQTRRVNLIVESCGWEGVYICADPMRFRQVVLNLMGNAVKYNRQSGRVVVNFALPMEGWLRLSVRDTGTGIAKEKHAQVFEPFNRLGAEMGQIEGTGVGLAIAKQLTEAMGGRMGFDSAEGQGSLFWIELPLIDAPSEVMQRALKSAQDRHLPACRLLYIGSRPSATGRLSSLLADTPQVEVLTSIDAMEGIFIARTRKPDIVLFDGDLPGIAINDLVAILRADTLTASIKLLAVNNNTCEIADGTLPQWFSGEALAETLTDCL